jgi:DNA primase
MDVVSVWQHGVAHVTASLGTALTEQQARLLARFADRVILAYDMDEAGQAAATKGGEVLRAAGLDVRVMSLPSGKDPDEYIRAHGREDFLAQAEAAMPYLEYRLTRLLAGFDLEQKEGAVAFLKTASGVLAGMSPVERDYYVKWLGERTGISASAIDAEAGARAAAQEIPRPHPRPRPLAVQARTSPRDRERMQRVLLRLLLHDAAFLADLRGRGQDFTSPDLARIFHAAVAAAEDATDGIVDVDALEAELSEEDAGTLRSIMKEVLVEEDPRRQLESCLAQIDKDHLSERSLRVNKALTELIANDGDREKILQLHEELNEINKELSEAKERIR